MFAYFFTCGFVTLIFGDCNSGVSIFLVIFRYELLIWFSFTLVDLGLLILVFCLLCVVLFGFGIVCLCSFCLFS